MEHQLHDEQTIFLVTQTIDVLLLAAAKASNVLTIHFVKQLVEDRKHENTVRVVTERRDSLLGFC